MSKCFRYSVLKVQAQSILIDKLLAHDSYYPRGLSRGKQRECESRKPKTLPVAMRLGDTPVPIPNTTVKTQSADDTWRETARESRWLPDQKFPKMFIWEIFTETLRQVYFFEEKTNR